MKTKSIVLGFIFCILTIPANSQELEHQAPTLQVGLNSLNFTKGTLDPDVISAIIAEKQREIKIKVIQNSFLKKVYGSGGTIYNYADNIIKGVVEEPDTDIRTRKIMESTVNLVFVYTFTDFYLKNADPNYIKNMQNLAEGYGLIGLKDFDKGLKYEELLNQLNDKSTTKTQSKKILVGKNIEDENNRLYNFMSLLIDISSEVVRENEELQNLGLMRISYSTNYDYLNMYNKQKDYLTYETSRNKNDSIYNENNLKHAKNVHKNMSDFLKQYTHSIGALKYIIEEKNFKSNNIDLASLKLSNKAFVEKKKKSTNFSYSINNEDISFEKATNTLIKHIETLSSRLVEESSNNPNPNITYIEDLKSSIVALTESLNYLKRISIFLESKESIGDKILMFSDILYTLKMEVVPNIEAGVKHIPDLINSKEFITNLSKEIYLELVSDSKFKSLNTDPEPFVNLVSKLYEFDETKTFSEYINLISLLDELFVAGGFKSALSMINTFVKDYTEITTDLDGNEVLVFNVESFLVRLQSLQSDKISRFQFHFTVGMNTTAFFDSLELENGETITTLSNFSEKIGFKFKFKNWGDWWPKNPGETYGSFGYEYIKTGPPREPIVSNAHILVYGSGLLYSIIDSSTNSNFDIPMVGTGLGLTFFNNLDFNVSVGIPLINDASFQTMTDNAFLNFGFDVQIIEYLSAVAKKKRERQMTKKTIESN